jgi:hypothetical protein
VMQIRRELNYWFQLLHMRFKMHFSNDSSGMCSMVVKY